MGFEALTVAVPGGEIFATRRGVGEGPPTLLFHGGPGVGAENLVSLVEELDGLIDGVLPQQRGLEPSTLAGPRDVETHVADAIAVLDHLGWERAWLIGHAWGGYLAMQIAIAHPDRVAGLIGIGTLGANAPDGGEAEMNGNLVARLTPDERTALDALLARVAEGDDDPTLMAQILMTLWPSYSYVHGNVLPPVTLRLERPLGDDRDTMPSVAAHFQAGTLERGLPNLDLAALFLHGEGDPLPASGSIESAALIKGARVQLVEEAGHFPWIERPGVVRAAVEAFLRETR
jgi:proline iminopeptidase